MEDNQVACIAVGIIREMKDEAVFSEYRAVAADALAKHGGTILIPPSPPTVLDGEDAPAAVVILEFPDKGSAEAWRRSRACLDPRPAQRWSPHGHPCRRPLTGTEITELH